MQTGPATVVTRSLPPLACDQRKQATDVAAVQPVVADLVSNRRVECYQPRRASQFQCQKQRGRCSVSERCGSRDGFRWGLLVVVSGPRAYPRSAVRRPIGSFLAAWPRLLSFARPLPEWERMLGPTAARECGRLRP